MSLNSELVARWRARARAARREGRPVWVTPVQYDELQRLGGVQALERKDDGTETLFGVPLERR